MSQAGTPERPVYTYKHDPTSDDWATKTYMVTVDEGWRFSILCGGMYEWAAKWLVEKLQGEPFAPEQRP